jgi:hypothetical protein
LRKKIEPIKPPVDKILFKINNDLHLSGVFKAIRKFPELESELRPHSLLFTNNIKEDLDYKEIVYSIRLKLEEIPKCLKCKIDLNWEKWQYYPACCSKSCGHLYNYENMSEEEKIKRAKNASISYHNKNDEKKQLTKDKRKQTFLDKYGVTHNFLIEGAHERIKETWVKNLGVDSPAKNKDVIQKIKDSKIEKYGHSTGLKKGLEPYNKRAKTWFDKYGVDHIFSSGLIREKVKETLVLKYGVDHQMKNVEFKDEFFKNHPTFKSKEYYFNERRFFLYKTEINFIENYLKDYDKNDIFLQHEISQFYKFLYRYESDPIEKVRKYYPDFYVKSENCIYEIKSDFTLDLGLQDNSIKTKANCVIKEGVNFKIVVYRRNKKIIIIENEKLQGIKSSKEII